MKALGRLLFTAAGMLALFLGISGAARADTGIAVVGPMTGGYASFGLQMKAGAVLAVEDINKAGGILGKKIKLFKEDESP